jgi:pimeloyl-ACP methyl ester carboxylesterase
MTTLQAVDGVGLGHLVNNTIGKHLPSLFKRFNHRHISSLDEHEYRQMHAHIDQVVHLETHCEMDCLAGVDIPVLFVNGEHDEYTSAEDVRVFAEHLDDCKFAIIDNAGHFLDMEHKAAWQQSSEVLLGFLQSQPPRQTGYRAQADMPHALAV